MTLAATGKRRMPRLPVGSRPEETGSGESMKHKGECTVRPWRFVPVLSAGLLVAASGAFGQSGPLPVVFVGMVQRIVTAPGMPNLEDLSRALVYQALVDPKQ